MDIIGVAWIVGIVVAAIVVVMILTAAFRGMRPKAPEAQVYTPSVAVSRTTPTSASPTTATGLTPQLTAEIDRLVGAGQKIHAIKLLREHTGLSLKGAKDRIDHWSVSTTAPHLAAVSNASAATSSITPATATPASIRATLPVNVAVEIDRLVASNQPIVAIKLLRQHTGFGLKETKDLIDAWR
ncbi:hypothetical protein [Microbacterium sp. NPDC087665]|uniref:hypothetical protein n=1 Tax=Microbacterium sp. NPDC087665 TaxID=3364194 RepID=UPI00382686E2